MTSETEVRRRTRAVRALWSELFPAEQARIIELLVERIDLSPTGIDLRLRVAGLTSLCNDLRRTATRQQEAA